MSALFGPRARPHPRVFPREPVACATLCALASLLLASCDLTDPDPRAETLVVLPGEVILDALGARRTLTFLVRDETGVILRAVPVEWTSADPSRVPVSSQGVLTALAPGDVEITARIGQLEAHATVRVRQVPRRVEAVTGEGQRGPAGVTLPGSIVVRVSDRLGTAVPGADVHFAPSHGGSVPAEVVAADQDGFATTSWTLGPEPGTQHLAVTVGGRHTFHLLAGAEDETGHVPFRIHVHMISESPAGVEDALDRAVRRWEPLLREKLPPVRVRVGEGRCGENAPALDEVVDDVLVLVTVAPLDGAGGVVAQANPCFLRQESFLPIAGQLRLDEDDVEALRNAGILEDLIAHELGHVLGVGSLWDLFGFLRLPSLPDARGADTHFAGPAAIAAFDQVGGAGYPGAKVPVENELGEEGTRDRHWRESVLGNELLTGFLSSSAPNPLSRVTLASLADLGYMVDLDAAEPFELPEPGAATAGGPPRFRIHHLDTRDPVYLLDRRGRIVRVLAR